MEFQGFEWDHANLAKCKKHGISIAAIEASFRQGLMILPDEAHSWNERRFRGIGQTPEGRALFVVFTMRRRGTDTLIRAISARYMHRKEADHYAKTYKT